MLPHPYHFSKVIGLENYFFPHLIIFADATEGIAFNVL